MDGLADGREEQRRALLPGWPVECTFASGGPKSPAQIGIQRECPQRISQGWYIARLNQQSFATVLGQVRQVPSAPSHDGQPEGHCLAINRPIWLFQAR